MLLRRFAVVLLTLLPAVLLGETLQDNTSVARLETPHCVLVCTAPEIIRRGDPVIIAVEFAVRGDKVLSVRNCAPGHKPDGRFHVRIERDGKSFYARNRGPAGALEPQFDRGLPGEVIRSTIDITEILEQVDDADQVRLWVSVDLNGEVVLPWPNRHGFSLSVGVNLTILDPEEYDAIAAVEKGAVRDINR